MKRFLFSALAVLSVVLGGLAFKPNVPPPLTLVAQGDSLTGIVTFTRQGSPDSIIASYAGANISTVRHKLTTQTADTALIVPSPFLLPGGSVTVTVTLVPWTGNSAGASKTASASYQRPAGVTITGFTVTSP